jgi:hypothetical protein
MKLDELRDALRKVDPAAVLVSQTVLARVVQHVSGVTWATWFIPHTHCLSLNRATLFDHVEQEELYLPPHTTLPPTVLLLEAPTPDQLAGTKPDQLLQKYWRLLFHASLHRALEERLARVPDTAVRERIDRLGSVEFEEARSVLIHDGHLVDGADDRTTYIEFAAYFLELRWFAANLVPVHFPSLPPLEDVEALLTHDVDAAALYRATKLEGAADPTPKTDDQSDESDEFFRRLMRSATKSANSDDIVGAAILHTRAARVAPSYRTRPTQESAREDIYKLIANLQQVLRLNPPEVEAWQQVLPKLLDKADQGVRPVEAALLYDLQRAWQDASQPIFSVDVLDWLYSAGHRPIKRSLDSQQFVRIPAHLRSAIRRLAAARLADADRRTLGGLLRDALSRAEERLREQFRPVLTDALKDAGLFPTLLPEDVALAKTVEELLDRISTAGFLGFADVRDAIARGQMKLADLRGPHEYVRGDPLLRLDRRLTKLLEGVYRGAESYTRGLEWLTSVGFGTRVGRWITQNVSLPFGGAVLGAEFVWLLVYERNRQVAVQQDRPVPDFFAGWNAMWQFHIAWFLVGLMLLATIRSAGIRSALYSAGMASYKTLRFLCWDIPLQVWNNPFVRGLFASVPAQVVINYLVKPLVLCSLLWAVFPESLSGKGSFTWEQILTYLAAMALVNSPLGRSTDLLLLELARSVINLFHSLPAVIRWVNDQFRDLVYALEWVLARVEDWLRIRGRSGPMAVAVRAVAGVLWMPFAFLIRFYTVVLIEPMINPLKLPLSLLFAKFVYPLLAILGIFTLDPLGSPLVDQLAPVLSQPLAWIMVIGTFWLSPDLVTYLFWEMRENWRLYQANTPDALKAVPVGPHGETVKRLLDVGFHSGTVPRLYARLRAAELEAAKTEFWREARTYRQALRGVDEAIRSFVARDLVAIVNSSADWKQSGHSLAVEDVKLGTNRITIDLRLLERTSSEETNWLRLKWEDRSGWLVACCEDTGFLGRLTPQAMRTFENALVYLYKRAGIDLISEQVRATLSKEATHFDFAPSGLLVWYGSNESTPVLYDPDDPGEEIRPRNRTDRHLIPGPTLDADRLVFSRLKLAWGQWLAVWKPHDPAGLPPRFGPKEWELTLLPPASPLVQPASQPPGAPVQNHLEAPVHDSLATPALHK